MNLVIISLSSEMRLFNSKQAHGAYYIDHVRLLDNVCVECFYIKLDEILECKVKCFTVTYDLQFALCEVSDFTHLRRFAVKCTPPVDIAYC